MEENILIARDLVKQYGKTRAVDGISFRIQKGEVLGLLGPNGAGKTTTIHMLLGLLTPTSGSVEAFGLPLATARGKILSRANFAASYVALPYNLTVEENLAVFGRLYGIRERKARIAALLSRFGSLHLRKQKFGKLSSGERTRVILAKAFLNDPELLFLDEPTAFLDPDFAEQVREAIEELRSARGTAILWTSHNMREIERMCDRVLFLQRGKIIADATPADLLVERRRGNLEDAFLSIVREEDRS